MALTYTWPQRQSPNEAFRHLVGRVTLVAFAGMAGCGALVGCGGGAPAGSTSSSVPATAVSPPSATTVASQPPPPPAPRHTPRPDPCPPRSSVALRQTEQRPSTSDACFHAIVHALWRGIREDSPRTARYAFFPLRAYEQLKAIADPYSDYTGRLLVDYQLDLRAAHALLGSRTRAARLVGAVVPQADVRWIPPDACYNRLGYYEVPNARLVYRVGGQVRSFGIASLISWRGTWYVVHLGAVKRLGYGGEVDDPSDGPGASAPSSTC
jgi:hypothetical protein